MEWGTLADHLTSQCHDDGSGFIMSLSRISRYFRANNGTLNGARFKASRRYISGRPTAMTQASRQFSDREDNSMQHIQDIAHSFVRVSIEDSSESSQTPNGDTARGMRKPRAGLMTTSKSKQKKHKDKKRAPSHASGGVPNPTKEYLEISNTSPEALSTPQNLLVVIDLNGTLLHRPGRHSTKFLTRPHAKLFLQYCIETFNVIIWSSARPENVRTMCDTIIPRKLRDQVVGIWGREKFGLTPEDYNDRVQCYKRLERLWNDQSIAATHPSYKYGGRWDQTNTVLIDDSLEKARSEPHNLVEVPEWFGDLGEAGDILPQVHDYLNYLSQQSNVSACLRAQPFGAHRGGLQA